MAQVQFDVPYSEQRNRGTVAIRIILAIPHLVLVSLWANVVQIVAVIHWFIQLVTGRRNRGLNDFTILYLSYSGRVSSYAGLLYDAYPEFVTDHGRTPVRFAMANEEQPVNRLTVGLRILWAIPSIIIGFAIGIAAFVVTVLGWFAILFTGRMAVGWHGFLVRAHTYVLQQSAYLNLLTDEYPRF